MHRFLASVCYWDRGRLARNEPSGSTASTQKTCSRFALIAGETPAVPVIRNSKHATQSHNSLKLPLDVVADRFIVVSALVLCSIATFVAVLALTFEGRGIETFRSVSANIGEDDLDKTLTRTATAALGDREGTVIVMDPRTGRIRVVVNPQVAFATTLAPGSTIKPFTTLAGLRTGLIDKERRMVCREHFTTGDFATVCSHPTGVSSFGTAEAIAYSCNYYFGKLGEQLREPSFDSTLAEFGFGEPTGINWTEGREASGKLPHGDWRAQNALGESDQIQVTPIQLLTAYAALVNGEHLLIPRIAPGKDFVARPRSDIAISEEQRQQIVEGMRGAVRYGTAERARLHSLPLYIFGKTGTSTQNGGFRTQGWFVGFASPLNEGGSYKPSAPENVRLAVLIFLKRGHGSDAAELARPIFETYARGVPSDDAEMRGRGESETRRHAEGETGRRGNKETESTRPEPSPPLPVPMSPRLPFSSSPRLRVPVSPRPGVPASVVRVHFVNENVTTIIALEDYVLGVVGSEGSTESEPQALKALAVAARTYALRNLSRHDNEGYDFCTTTHCQRYNLINQKAGSDISSLILNAVRQTAGEVLYGADDQVADSYFSASCGGATANISALWGARAPTYLTGAPDEYCVTGPRHAWTDVISEDDLVKALRSDSRTDVGNRLSDVRVTQRDASGRAQLITIAGGRRLMVSGWDFKIIVGRALGWNLLKSSRFEISRSGKNYVFRGSGFGHGLGLCQEGAHVMARRGAGYQQILAMYFPGTSLSGTGRWGERGTGRISNAQSRPDRKRKSQGALLLHNHHPISPSPSPPVSFTRRSLAGEHFRISYPEEVKERDAENVLKILETSRNDLIRRVSAAGISFRFPSLEIFINETTGDFVGRTGQPPWVAAATRGNRVELQPLALLKRRRVLETTLRHELVHSAIDTIGRGHTPRWFGEGLALHIAGEGPMLTPYLRKTETSIEVLERRLWQPVSQDDMRAAYAAAYHEVKTLIASEGEASVWRRVSKNE